MKTLLYPKIHDEKLLVLKLEDLGIARRALVLDIYTESNGTWGGGSTILGRIKDLVRHDREDEKKAEVLRKKLARTDLPDAVRRDLQDDLRFLTTEGSGKQYVSYRRRIWEDLQKTAQGDDGAAARLIRTLKITWQEREFPECRFIIRRPKKHYEDEKEKLYPSDSEEPSDVLWLKIFKDRPPFDIIGPKKDVAKMRADLPALEACAQDPDPSIAKKSERLARAMKESLLYEEKEQSRTEIRKRAEKGDAAAAREYMVLMNSFNGGSKEYRADPVRDPKEVFEQNVKFIHDYANASFK